MYLHEVLKKFIKQIAMKGKTIFISVLFISQLLLAQSIPAQRNGKAVLAYYSGSLQALDSFDANSYTHLIYCFGHLQGNRLQLGKEKDTLLIQKMVGLKKVNPQLKVLVSLGGWGGCAPCSDVFGTKKGRKEFAQSVKEINTFFGADGIDLDWEYPTIQGYPGHRFAPEDKQHFTALVKQLRKTLGNQQLITFAAGGFQSFLDSAVEWNNVAPLVDYINLMTYDLVSGFAAKTGHHTPLYSTASQKESTDNCVQDLIRKGVEPQKLIIGTAFYARTFQVESAENNGLYQPGKFKDFIGYNQFPARISADSGYVFYWDDVAKAPYAYNAAQKLYATFDDKRSMEAKTKYVLQHNLGGIMFWQLGHDTAKDGLLQTINQTLQQGATQTGGTN
jgi:chitinase